MRGALKNTKKNTAHFLKTSRCKKTYKLCNLKYIQKIMNKTNSDWKFLLIASLICSSSFAQPRSFITEAAKVKATVTHVIDGDTVSIEAPWVPAPMKPTIAIRVYGVDTPEKSFRAQCEKEAELGLKATEYTNDLVSKAKRVQVVYHSWDKYGGRVLGDLFLDGKSLRNSLIINGYAREYYGDAKKSWCE